jgi:predicted  nucleic acid-binding Zn-ribbon protein
LVDLAKYETLISDLGKLESHVEILKNKYSDTLGRNKELEVSLNEIQADKSLLHQKISEMESELEEIKLNSEEKTKLNSEEREEIKIKIRDLISRIDKHLSSDWSQ